MKEWIKREWNNNFPTPIHEWLHEKFATLEEAIEYAEKHFHKPQSKTPSKSSEEIIREIRDSQIDPEIVEEWTREANIGLTRKMLEAGVLRCPYCGGCDLVWACTGIKIGEEKKE